MKHVLITGATSGIGYALAKLYAAKGYGLVLVSSNRSNLEQAKQSLIKKYDVPIELLEQDLSKQGAAQKVYEEVRRRAISIDVLINNAGYGLVGRTQEIDFSEDEKMITLNVETVVALCKLFLKDMVERNQGEILNVASTGAFQPGPYTSTYFASKAFVLSYSKAIRYELKDRNITVTALCPGSTRTNFFHREKTKTPKNAMAAEQVAALAYKGLKKKKEVVVPGMKNKLFLILPQKLKMIGIAMVKQKYCFRDIDCRSPEF